MELIVNLIIIYPMVALAYFIINTIFGLYIARKYNKEAKLFSKTKIDNEDVINKMLLDLLLSLVWVLSTLYFVFNEFTTRILCIKNKTSFKQRYLDFYYNNNCFLYRMNKLKWEDSKLKESFTNKKVSNDCYLELKKDSWLLKNVSNKYKYITKDKNGKITVHKQKPFNIDGYWFAEDIAIIPLENCFGIIDADSKEPLLIKELIPIVQKAIDEYNKNNNPYYRERE